MPREYRDLKKVLKEVFEHYFIESYRLTAILQSNTINSSQVYFELVRLHSIGAIKDLNKIIYTIIRHLTTDAHNSRRYMEFLQTDPIHFPTLIPFSYYLDLLYKEVLDADILIKDLPKEFFLDAFLAGSRLNPGMLVDFLEDGKWITEQFGLAHVMYLACKTCIYQVAEVNQCIAKYIKYLTTYSTPRKLASEAESHHLSIQDRFEEIFQTCGAPEKIASKQPQEPEPQEPDQASAPDHNIDDLFAQFGM